ncbi:Dps family protein [Mesomycoplasma lagogenitalium]|uniref:DNA starvation/stationary phase protection protein n=1 Tax=Mesomycoplasma lagogenitalium TaxID=171286 RepID=A0ABY8LUV6_9BACT|nr:DNA starvation/stationary phase protection protein [Mesomycoplasma lagogenitalium]WGI37013.1 DNA starvation/stationary phase protection protein [Mesomycoplasma lagogenitalium]
MEEINKLKKLQASLQVFYQKINNIHWNIKGLEFFEIHEITDKLKDDVLNFVDEVAEKIVMKDELAIGSYSEILKYSFLKEMESKYFDYKIAIFSIVEDLNQLLTFVEDENWSARVQPILDELLTSFDKWKWQFSALAK